jgi:hypothetical protein
VQVRGKGWAKWVVGGLVSEEDGAWDNITWGGREVVHGWRCVLVWRVGGDASGCVGQGW